MSATTSIASERAKWESVGYDRISFHRRLPFVKKIIGYGPESVLDIGCGTGADLALIKILSPATKISGLDMDKEILSEFKRRLEKLGDIEADIYAGTFEAFWETDKFPSNSHDVVISNAALMYSNFPAIILDEMLRIAKRAVILMELPTIHLTNALKNHIMTSERISYDDIDVVWRNFGHIYEIKK